MFRNKKKMLLEIISLYLKNSHLYYTKKFYKIYVKIMLKLI